MALVAPDLAQAGEPSALHFNSCDGKERALACLGSNRMTGPARATCIYDEVDSATFGASERFAMWRETGRLPMAAEPTDADSRRRFHIRLRRLSGVSGGFTDLTATPLKLSRENSHHARD